MPIQSLTGQLMVTDDPFSAEQLLEHVEKLLLAAMPPDLPAGAKGAEKFAAIDLYLRSLRTLLQSFARGDLQPEITLRGALAGSLKALQANLHHLTWQIHQVASGDFTQRVDFLGEFAVSFNSMVEKLDNALAELRLKEEELTRLTAALQDEVEQKSELLEALRKSEASFRYKAAHDPLTGILNRRSFYDMAAMELERTQKDGKPCCIGLFDIDTFKRFNDGHGHIAGDSAIRHTTTIGKRLLRQNDIMGRFGGDEIVFLLSSVDTHVGASVAERLRSCVAQTPVSIAADQTAPMTISIGLSCILPDIPDQRDVAFLEKVISHADSALYAAKNAGRNTVAVGTFPGEQFSIVTQSDSDAC